MSSCRYYLHIMPRYSCDSNPLITPNIAIAEGSRGGAASGCRRTYLALALASFARVADKDTAGRPDRGRPRKAKVLARRLPAKRRRRDAARGLAEYTRYIITLDKNLYLV